jgi:hypothetical protein
MSEDVPPHGVEAWLTRLRNGVNQAPIDWNAIRGASMSLDGEARTKDQKTAVEQLKRASEGSAVQRAVSAVERTFLDGKPGIDGWPRRS